MSVSLRYFASVSLLLLGIGLLAMQWAMLDGWYDNMSRYAAKTPAYGGPCAAAYGMDDGAERDAAIAAECDNGVEPWQMLPLLLGLGLVIGTISIAWPWTYYFDDG